MTVTWQDLFGDGPVVLDGGLSTQLEQQGQDISGSLWTARALLADPTAVTRAHAAYLSAGADVVITSSYQLSRRGFVEIGLTPADADAALRASTRVARVAAEGTRTRVAASVGPFGAIRHDGSEYRGRYGLTHGELVAFHRERLDVIAMTAPDLLAVETIPDVDEATALADVLADHPGLLAWMTFSCVDGAHTCAGQSIEDAVAVASAIPTVAAVGVNCTDPRYVAELVQRTRAVTDLAIVVYANAGGTWDAATGEWQDTEIAGGVFTDDLIDAWRAAGAVAIGGCCGTDARAISAIARRLASPAR
jgi:homocysteine S-methyltransferase